MDLKAALFSEGSLEFNGPGSLIIHSFLKHGIVSDEKIVLENGNIDISTDKKDGIRVNESFVMKDGVLNILASEGKGIKVKGKESLTHPAGHIIINNGKVKIDSYDKAITASWTVDDAINAENQIIINGGMVYAQSTSGDGIDSNGTVLITGGTTIGMGAPGRGEGGIDCDRNSFVIEGGTVVAVGGRNSTPTGHGSDINSISLSNLSQTLVSFKNSKGDFLLGYQMEKDHTSLLFASKKFLSGSEVELYLDGNIDTRDESFYGLFVSGNLNGASYNQSIIID